MGLYAQWLGGQISAELDEILSRPDMKRGRAEVARYFRTFALRHEMDEQPINPHNIRMTRRSIWTAKLQTGARVALVSLFLLIGAVMFAGYCLDLTASTHSRAVEAMPRSMKMDGPITVPYDFYSVED